MCGNTDGEKNGISREEGLFRGLCFFFISKWWPMQREEMTSQRDLHFTPLFEGVVSVLLCTQQTRGSEALVD